MGRVSFGKDSCPPPTTIPACSEAGEDHQEREDERGDLLAAKKKREAEPAKLHDVTAGETCKMYFRREREPGDPRVATRPEVDRQQRRRLRNQEGQMTDSWFTYVNRGAGGGNRPGSDEHVAKR
jgi:hypothetical protein